MKFEPTAAERHIAMSEHERQLVEQLEKLPMHDSSKLDLLLVWQGEKRASDARVIFRTWAKGENIPEVSPEEKKKLFNEAKATIQAMELYCVDGEEIEHEPEDDGTAGEINRELYASKDEKDAEELQKIWQENDEVKNARELGRFYGFPASAVEAYGQFFEQGYRKGFKNREMTIEENELPPEIQNQDFMAFVQFRLSRANWEEELETAKRWAEEIQNIDPALYERIVKRYHAEMSK